MKRKHQIVATWLFGLIFSGFLITVFFSDRAGRTHDPIVRLFAAVTAALFGYFLTGTIQVVSHGGLGKVGRMSIRASGGAAMFVLVWLTWPKPVATADGIKTAVEQQFDGVRSNLVSDVVGGVKHILDSMDTNRVRVESFTKKIEDLEAKGQARELELAQTKSELTNALVVIQNLRSRLESVVPVSQLSAADQERVARTDASVEKAKSVGHVQNMYVGTLRVGNFIGGSVPSTNALQDTNNAPSKAK